MIITSQGFGHFTEGLNNQDFGIETSKMLLVLDGCSGAKYSEVGTRLFAQLFSKRKDYDNLEKFEDNVKKVFEEILDMVKKHYRTPDVLEKEFIMENMLFTIIACFETDSEYIVKLFGDGYVITQNRRGLVSYMKHSYGQYPPYFAYKYCNLPEYKNYAFKTFSFGKKVFPKVAIATDGVMPIAIGDVKGLDDSIVEGNAAVTEMVIRNSRQLFKDDVTIGAFGGKK